MNFEFDVTDVKHNYSNINDIIQEKMSCNEIEELQTELVDKFRSVMLNLTNIWDEIGICETKRDERRKVVLHHLENLLGEMLSEEESLKARLMASVSKCSQEISNLCEQLSLPVFKPDEDLSLLKSESVLRKKVDELSEVKKTRLEKLRELSETEDELCNLLFLPKLKLKNEDYQVPSMSDLDELQQHIDMLKTEKIKRNESLIMMRSVIRNLMTSLEYEAITDLECEILSEDTSSNLSSHYMAEVEQLMLTLQGMEDDNTKKANDLRHCLKTLWERLNIDENVREDCLILHSGYRPSTIAALKTEVAKYEELKRQNIHRYVKKTRDELMALWDKCFFSETQRGAFTHLHDETYSEELLSLHEEEVQKMKDYYEANKEMLVKVHKREELWQKMIQFEKNAMDPKRFTNRGGGLLQEEQERKRLLCRLPKLEGELAALISEWEAKQHCKFFVNGQRFLDYVAAQWEQHRLDKENEKLERKRVRAEQLENELVRGIKPSTPHTKRLAIQTPTSGTKKPRLAHSSSAKTLLSTPTLKSMSRMGDKQTSCKKVGILKDRNCNDDSGFSVTAISGNHHQNIADDTITLSTGSYTEFTENLNSRNRDFCRSSMMSPAVKPLSSKKKRPQTPMRRRSPRLSVRKTPTTPLSSTRRIMTRSHLAKSPVTPIRHNLGLPFLI